MNTRTQTVYLTYQEPQIHDIVEILNSTGTTSTYLELEDALYIQWGKTRQVSITLGTEGKLNITSIPTYVKDDPFDLLNNSLEAFQQHIQYHIGDIVSKEDLVSILKNLGLDYVLQSQHPITVWDSTMMVGHSVNQILTGISLLTKLINDEL